MFVNIFWLGKVLKSFCPVFDLPGEKMDVGKLAGEWELAMKKIGGNDRCIVQKLFYVKLCSDSDSKTNE